MEQANINLKIVVFAQNERVRVINIEDFEGLDSEISAFGFNSNGEPILSSEQQSKYQVTGASHGGVNLNNVYTRGLNTDFHRNIKGELINNGKLHGYAAVALQLSRNGCAANPLEIQKAMESLIKSGITRIRFYRLCNINGMAQSYGMFEDKWLISGDIPEISYDNFNRLLKKIGSSWRIQSASTLKLLRKLELQKLTQETSDL